MTREQQEAIAVLQEFYDYNKTLTPHGESWLQADITINRETQRNLAEALPLAIEAMSRLLTDPDTGLVPCDYCTDTFDQKPLFQENKYKPYTRMMSTISIEENNGKHQIEIDLWDGGNVYAAFEINYCPMCGRKLEGRQ